MKNRVKAFLNRWSENDLKSISKIYIIFILALLILHTLYAAVNIAGIKSGKFSEKYLTVKDFSSEQLEILDDMNVINSGDDGKLIYSGDVRTFSVKCEFSYNPGEFVSFYNNDNSGVFSAQKMIYAKLIDGYYVFEYPLGTKQVRIDTGVSPSIHVSFDEIILNRPDASWIWGNITEMLFTMLIAPVVIYSLTDCIVEFGKKIISVK